MDDIDRIGIAPPHDLGPWSTADGLFVPTKLRKELSGEETDQPISQTNFHEYCSP